MTLASDFSRTFGVVLIAHFMLAWLLISDKSWTRKPPLAGITVEIGVAAPEVKRGLEQAVPAQGGDGGVATSSATASARSQRDEVASKSLPKDRPRQARSESGPTTPMDPERPQLVPSTPSVPILSQREASAHPGSATPAIPQGQSVEEETVRTYEPDLQAAYMENPKPPYPKPAFRMGAEGTVVVLVEVHEDGKAGAVRVAQSSGNELLDQSALETIKGWRFRSARKDGAMRKSVVKVPITFRLRAR